MNVKLNALPLPLWRQYWQKNISNRLPLEAEKLLSKVPSLENAFLIGRNFTLVMDYSKLSYLHLQGAFERILGYEPQRVLDEGIEFLYTILHPEDREKVAALSVYFQDFIHNLPVEKRKLVKTNLNFRMKAADGRYVRLLEQVIVIDLDANGLIAYTLKHFTDISHLPYTNDVTLSFVEEGRAGDQLPYTVIVEQKNDNPPKQRVFSARELEVLDLIAKGITSKEIAHELCLSIDTVKNHRKNMIRKAGCRNIAEVLNFAFFNQLL
jgi:DNA-binding CsgD family transcriptional regulator